MTASPSPPPAEQVEAAQVLYEALWANSLVPPPDWSGLMEGERAAWRRGVAALRPETSVAPAGMREDDDVWPSDLAWLSSTLQAAADAQGSAGHMRILQDERNARILAALPPASGSDHGLVGWRLVPEEPTREMWAAMGDALMGYRNRHHDKVAGQLWNDVLAAALPPPAGDK